MNNNIYSNEQQMNKEVTVVNMGFVNSYIICGEGRLILVDTGLPGNAHRIIKKVNNMGFKAGQVSLIVLTHAHFDHSGSVRALKDITGAEVAIHRDEAPFLLEGRSREATPVTGLARFMMRMVKNSGSRKIDGLKPDILIEDEMDLNDFGVAGKVISTPGHTEGSVSVFLDSGNCLVGDTIGSSLGRPTTGMFCDDMEMMKESIEKIKKSTAKKVYLSHDGIIDIDRLREAL